MDLQGRLIVDSELVNLSDLNEYIKVLNDRFNYTQQI